MEASAGCREGSNGAENRMVVQKKTRSQSHDSRVQSEDPHCTRSKLVCFFSSSPSSTSLFIKIPFSFTHTSHSHFLTFSHTLSLSHSPTLPLSHSPTLTHTLSLPSPRRPITQSSSRVTQTSPTPPRCSLESISSSPSSLTCSQRLEPVRPCVLPPRKQSPPFQSHMADLTANSSSDTNGSFIVRSRDPDIIVMVGPFVRHHDQIISRRTAHRQEQSNDCCVFNPLSTHLFELLFISPPSPPAILHKAATQRNTKQQ